MVGAYVVVVVLVAGSFRDARKEAVSVRETGAVRAEGDKAKSISWAKCSNLILFIAISLAISLSCPDALLASSTALRLVALPR